MLAKDIIAVDKRLMPCVHGRVHCNDEKFSSCYLPVVFGPVVPMIFPAVIKISLTLTPHQFANQQALPYRQAREISRI